MAQLEEDQLLKMIFKRLKSWLFAISFQRNAFVILTLIQILNLGLGIAADPNEGAAQKAYEQKKWDKVIELLGEKVGKISKKSHIILGKSYEENDNHVSAVKTYRTALSQFEKDNELRVLLADAQIKIGKDKDALVILKEILESDPKNESAFLTMASIYEKRKNRYELRLLYEDLDKFISPAKKPEMITKLCELYAVDGFHDHAKTKCDEGIRLDPKEPKNYVYLGQAFKETGNRPIALKHYTRAADSFSKSEFAQFTLGTFYNEDKNYLKACKYFKRATEADKKSVKAFVALAVCSIELQKYQESLDAYMKACELDKGTEPHLRKSLAHLRQAKIEPWATKFENFVERCNPAKNFNF